jgi:hypothetical protein
VGRCAQDPAQPGRPGPIPASEFLDIPEARLAAKIALTFVVGIVLTWNIFRIPAL